MNVTKYLTIAIVTLAILGCASTGKTNSSAEKSAEKVSQVASKSKKADVVCENNKATGTRVGKRVCKTKEAIEAERVLSREAVVRSQTLQGDDPTGG